jgi:hypothetical protein
VATFIKPIVYGWCINEESSQHSHPYRPSYSDDLGFFPPPMPPLSLTAEEAEALAQILLTQAKFLKVQQSN